MTPETARILAQALKHRAVAADGLIHLSKTMDMFVEPPKPITESMCTLAKTYVHETRIINRIIHDDTDESHHN